MIYHFQKQVKYLLFSSTPTLTFVSVNKLENHVHQKITNVTNAITSEVRVVSGRKRSPWRNTTLVREEKKSVEKLNLGVSFSVSRQNIKCLVAWPQVFYRSSISFDRCVCTGP